MSPSKEGVVPKRQKLPTWEQLGTAGPESLLEAQARIAHLTHEIAAIEEQLEDLVPPEKRDDAYRAWLVSASAARRRKQFHLRRLKVWVQDHKTKLSAARQLNRLEESVARQVAEAAPQDPAEVAYRARQEELREEVNRRLNGDLLAIGMALKHATKAWGYLIRIATAAKAYVDAEGDDTVNDTEVDVAFERLSAALEEASAKNYLSFAPEVLGT